MCGFLFTVRESSAVYQLIFGLILLSGLMTSIFAFLAPTSRHFISHSFTSLKQALQKMDWLRIVAVGLFGVSGMTSQINVIIPNTIDISEANISFFLAGTKILSLLTAFLIGKYMQHKHYPKIMTYSIIASIVALAMLIWQYTITGYIVYVLIIAISAVFMNLSQGVISNRREEYMKADKRAMTLIGETAIDMVRVGLSVVLLILGMHTVNVITGKVILIVFMVCLLMGAGLLARQGKKMQL
ncbi:MAG: hypothetical protein LBO09_08545 [Candidatus Peribacteria bacterium]|nr:hypothetical protein [Candidatus Peribacteria bacterium]